MRPLFGLMIASGLALGLAPAAFAFTYTPASSLPAGRQFVDPDAAFDNFSTSARDNALVSPSSGGGVLSFDGDGSGGSQTGRAVGAFGVGHVPASYREPPRLNAEQLYDNEPPFMPVVVGDQPTR